MANASAQMILLRLLPEIASLDSNGFNFTVCFFSKGKHNFMIPFSPASGATMVSASRWAIGRNSSTANGANGDLGPIALGRAELDWLLLPGSATILHQPTAENIAWANDGATASAIWMSVILACPRVE